MHLDRSARMHGDIAINWASNVIGAFHEPDGLSFEETLDYFGIDYKSKILEPQKKTILHDYIEVEINDEWLYLLRKHFPVEVIKDLSEAMTYYGVDLSSLGAMNFECGEDGDTVIGEFEDAEDYAGRLFDLFQETLLGTIVDDVFTILYSDKNFLHDFNVKLAEVIRELKVKDYPDILKEDGVVNRCGYWPSWLKRGVFLRDKGRCQLCGCDLTQLLNLDAQPNFDHIVPLQQGGVNDPTNLQLTCEHCNKAKRDRGTAFNNIASPFWELDTYKAFGDSVE